MVSIVLLPTDTASQEAVDGSAQRVVVARARVSRDTAVHHYRTSAISIRILSSSGALGRSYNSRMYFRKLHHALSMRRSTSMDRLALWLTSPPRYANSFVWLCTWPAASMSNMVVDSDVLFVRKHIISVLAFDAVEPNAAHTATIMSIIFLRCLDDCETTPPSSE